MCIPKVSSAPPTRPPSNTQHKSKLFPVSTKKLLDCENNVLFLQQSSPVFDMINSQPVKRKSPNISSFGDNKRQKLAPTTEGSGVSNQAKGAVSKWCTADRQLQFDMPGVTKRCMLQGDKDTAQNRQAKDKVIGWCQQPGQGVWLVIHNAAIALFNVCRCV